MSRDGAVDLDGVAGGDHGGSVESPQRRLRGLPTGGAGAAPRQVPEVLGPQPGRDSAHDVPVQSRVDAAEIRPERDRPPAHRLVQGDTLAADTTVTSPLGGTRASNSTAAPSAAADAGGSITLTANEDGGSSDVDCGTSSRVGPLGRNRLAGVVMSSARCGR